MDSSNLILTYDPAREFRFYYSDEPQFPLPWPNLAVPNDRGPNNSNDSDRTFTIGFNDECQILGMTIPIPRPASKDTVLASELDFTCPVQRAELCAKQTSLTTLFDKMFSETDLFLHGLVISFAVDEHYRRWAGFRAQVLARQPAAARQFSWESLSRWENTSTSHTLTSA